MSLKKYMKKQQIDKDSLATAKIRFWGELRDLGLSQSKKEKLLTEFERWFDESLDYDLASNHVLETIMSMKSMSAFKEVFSSIGQKKINKGFFENEQDKARRMIDEEFKSGKREIDILDDLLLSVQRSFGRSLEQFEIDRLRYLVIDEKVKLNTKGVKIAG